MPESDDERSGQASLISFFISQAKKTLEIKIINEGTILELNETYTDLTNVPLCMTTTVIG